MEKPHCSADDATTTFVRADATSFKDLVQRLTGLRDLQYLPPPSPNSIPSSSSSSSSSRTKLPRLKRPRLKLAASSPAGFMAAEELDREEEERAIRERRFYLHSWPRSRARAADPELLPLFPLASTPNYSKQCDVDGIRRKAD